jgi:hypothetical protein
MKVICPTCRTCSATVVFCAIGPRAAQNAGSRDLTALSHTCPKGQVLYSFSSIGDPPTIAATFTTAWLPRPAIRVDPGRSKFREIGHDPRDHDVIHHLSDRTERVIRSSVRRTCEETWPWARIRGTGRPRTPSPLPRPPGPVQFSAFFRRQRRPHRRHRRRRQRPREPELERPHPLPQQHRQPVLDPQPQPPRPGRAGRPAGRGYTTSITRARGRSPSPAAPGIQTARRHPHARAVDQQVAPPRRRRQLRRSSQHHPPAQRRPRREHRASAAGSRLTQRTSRPAARAAAHRPPPAPPRRPQHHRRTQPASPELADRGREALTIRVVADHPATPRSTPC